MPVPAAGTQLISGTSGMVKSFLSTPSATVDYLAAPVTGTQAVLATLNEWTYEGQVQSNAAYVFGGPASASGVAGPLYTQGGLGDWTLTLSGYFDANSATGQNSSLRLMEGCFVWLDCLYHAGSGFGHYNVYAKIVGGGSGTKMEGGQATFRRTCKVHGLWPVATYPA